MASRFNYNVVMFYLNKAKDKDYTPSRNDKRNFTSAFDTLDRRQIRLLENMYMHLNDTVVIFKS